MSARRDVIVLGAGVVGLSAARRLAGRGAAVVVLDPASPGGQGARAAAGVIVPSVRLLGDPAMLAFTRAATSMLEADLASLSGRAGPLHRCVGILRTVAERGGGEELRARAAAAGYDLGDWLDAAGAAELEPALAGAAMVGAFADERGYVVDADAYVTALQHDAAAAGVELRLGEGAVAVEDGAGGVLVRTWRGELRGDLLVVAAGAWSGAIPGLRPLPIRPLRGQMLAIAHPRLRLGRIVCNERGGYLAPWRSRGMVVGATEEDAGFAAHTTPAGLLHLSATVARTTPGLRDARVLRAWAGLRAAGPGPRPLLGPYPDARRTLLASAHGGQGILTGALSGEIVADLADGRRPQVAAPFDPTTPPSA